jgi:acetate kinase
VAPSRMTRARRSSRGRNPNAWMSRIGHTGGLVTAGAHGDPAAPLAIGVYAHGVCQEIAAAGSLDRLDALVFTRRTGVHWRDRLGSTRDPPTRSAPDSRCSAVTIPVSGNREQDGPVSPDAAVPVLVVQTPRGMQLARDTTTALG